MATPSMARLLNRQTRHSPLGRCIYCGLTDPHSLTDEHILPYHLGSNAVLPKASCRKCAALTSAIELHCGRVIFRDFRHHHKMSSRRKKRPATLKFWVKSSDDQVRYEEVAFDAAPHFLVLPQLGRPNLFASRNTVSSEVEPHSLYHWTTIDAHDRAQVFLKDNDVEWGIDLEADWAIFCRFLAKTALCQVASLIEGYPTETSPLVPIINGTDPMIRRLIGGTSDSPAVQPHGTGPALPAFTCTTKLNVLTNSVTQQRMLYADITLFKDIMSPTYTVIVGKAPEGRDLTKLARPGLVFGDVV